MKFKLLTLTLGAVFTVASPLALAQTGVPAALEGVQAALRSLTATVNQLATQVTQLVTLTSTQMSPSTSLYAGPLPVNAQTTYCSATNISNGQISITMAIIRERVKDNELIDTFTVNNVAPLQTVKLTSAPFGLGTCRFTVADTKTITASISVVNDAGSVLAALPAALAR